MFNQTVSVSPKSTVEVVALIKNYNISCNYNVLVEGKESGRQFKIYGKWEGISYAEVDYTINEYNSAGAKINSYTKKGNINTELSLGK